jgi:membrane protease YdiL (CAAX protease family)
MKRATRPRLPALAGLFVALVLPGALTASVGDLPLRGNAVMTELADNIAIWALTLLLLAIVLFWERRPLSSIGLVRPTWNAVLAGGAAAVGLIVLSVAAGAAITALGMPLGDKQQTTLLTSLPFWLQAFVVVGAGFTEEILFRGYAIERVIELTGSRWVGALVPVLVFGAFHVPFWGIAHAMVVSIAGLWLALIYLWRRNLWTNITAHTVADGLILAALNVAAAHGAT